MPERTPRRPRPLGLVLLFAAACGADDERSLPRVTSEGNPLVVPHGGPEYALDGLGVVSTRAPQPAAQAPLAELPFQELSDGLPPSGSWSGRPLLLEFGGEVHGLVASNCEEEGYSCWLAPPGPGQTWQRRDEGLPRALGCEAACATDLDRDGKPDLVLSTSAHGAQVFLGVGAQTWRVSEPVLPDSPPVAGFALGDLDGDGVADLAGLGYPRGGLQLFLGEARGGLRPATGPSPLLEADFGRDLCLADLDLDGRSDLVLATGAGLRAFLTEPAQTLRWREESRGLPAPPRPDSLCAVCVGRFTADPRPQIAVCSQPDPGLALEQRDTIGVYGWNEAQQAWEHVDTGLPRGERYSDLRAADFDGDGNLDLVALSLEHGAAIYLGDGRGGFRAKGRLAGVHGRGHVAVGHVDGNLLPDIVVSVSASKDDPEGGGVRAFLNRRPIWDSR